MYTGYWITDESRSKLLEIFPPVFKNVIAHHITEEFGVHHGEAPPMPNSVQVVGTAVSHKLRVQALIVRINGNSERGDGGPYHITWSIDRSYGAKPVHSNKAVREEGRYLKGGYDVEVVPKFFF